MTVTDDIIEGEVLPAVQAPAPVTLFRTDEPGEVLRRATTTADALATAAKDRGLIAKIGGKDYPTVEAWTMLGTMLGVFPVCVWTRPLENGWEARVEARTLAGQLVGAAEAQCTRTEKSWSNRDDYALRSMAQTRATSKALRLPLGFVMSLAGYEATPVEEMPLGNHVVNTRTGEIVAPERNAQTGAVVVTEPGPESGFKQADWVQARTASASEPEPEPPAEPYQPQTDTYVDPEPGPDDIPFESTAPPAVEEDREYDPAQMARAALIRRSLGVVVSHGADITEEKLFDGIEKLSRDGRSVFFGFKGTEFEDLSESQAKKVLDWIDQADRKLREGTG